MGAICLVSQLNCDIWLMSAVCEIRVISSASLEMTCYGLLCRAAEVLWCWA